MSQRKNEELKKVFAFFSTCYPRWSAKLVPCKRTPEIETRDYDRLTESMQECRYLRAESHVLPNNLPTYIILHIHITPVALRTPKNIRKENLPREVNRSTNLLQFFSSVLEGGRYVRNTHPLQQNISQTRVFPDILPIKQNRWTT